MGGGAAAVQQTRRGEHERAGADRGDAARGRRPAANPAHQRVVGERGPGVVTSGNDQRVQRRADMVERAVRDQREPTGGPQWLPGNAGQRHQVAGVGATGVCEQPPGTSEHLDRAGHIQTLHAGEGDDHDLPCCHA